MSNLKRSLFWVAFYLLMVFLLGQLDYADRPVINLASYFYLLVFVVVPCVVLIPFFFRIPSYFAMIFWASIYFALSRVIDRSMTASDGIETVLVELILLELGVWLSYQLAVDIAHSESLLDTIAQNAFPNYAVELNSATERIGNEIARSRRYQRPLSLVLFQAVPENSDIYRKFFKNFQQDLASRFSSARIGQMIGTRVRQTDLLIRDHLGRFIVLCPETDRESIVLLGERIYKDLQDGMELKISWGTSTFPDDALTFDDMLNNARKKTAVDKLALTY